MITKVSEENDNITAFFDCQWCGLNSSFQQFLFFLSQIIDEFMFVGLFLNITIQGKT